jgi:RNA polymerase sigma factor (sigma-70 family)
VNCATARANTAEMRLLTFEGEQSCLSVVDTSRNRECPRWAPFVATAREIFVSETDLLKRVAAGDSTAMRACLDRYGALVWALARRFSPNASDAEDAVQDVFLDLWKSAMRFDPNVASETTFVAMVARRRLIDRRRKTKREPLTEDIDAKSVVPEPGAASRVEASVEARLADKALAQLRPEQRHVLLLSACHGMSHEEISKSMSMPLGTVKAHARRGLLRIREILFSGRNPEDPK